MNPFRRLAGQTAIYGIPSILGRFLNYLLVPLYTYGLLTPQEYGVVNLFYSYTAVLMVLLTYGMETAFFRFSEGEEDKNRVYSTGFLSLGITTLFFLTMVHLFSGTIAGWISYPEFPQYVIWFAWIIALDTLAAIPFARLRAMNRAGMFATIRMINILVNILLNLFFLLFCPWVLRTSESGYLAEFIGLIYRSDWTIEYIFIANLVASGLTMLLLAPQLRGLRWRLDTRLWGRMVVYALPLMLAGLAGILNESVDRILLRYLLPMAPADAEAQVGIYSACYKVAVLMVLFIQAYRFAAEPFFFSQMKNQDAKLIYARVMDYFIIIVSLIYLVTLLFLDTVFIKFTGAEFRGAREVIPILMLAKMFLGIYYNLSIWYKITGKTLWGALITAGGAVITIVLNILLIPLPEEYWIHGYLGSAWATLFCYVFMLAAAYLSGQRYYPIPYRLWRFVAYPGMALFLYFVSRHLTGFSTGLSVVLNLLLFLVFLFFTVYLERFRLRWAGK